MPGHLASEKAKKKIKVVFIYCHHIHYKKLCLNMKLLGYSYFWLQNDHCTNPTRIPPLPKSHMDPCGQAACWLGCQNKSLTFMCFTNKSFVTCFDILSSQDAFSSFLVQVKVVVRIIWLIEQNSLMLAHVACWHHGPCVLILSHSYIYASEAMQYAKTPSLLYLLEVERCTRFYILPHMIKGQT